MCHDVDAWPMSSHVSATATETNNKQLFVAIIKKRANFHTQPVGAACRLCWCLCVRTSALITAHYSDQSVACCQLEDTSNNVTLSPYCHCLLLLPLPTAACRLLLAATPQTTTINVEWQQLQAATRALSLVRLRPKLWYSAAGNSF